MPDFKLRLQVKAGLTGYAQVYGKYNTDPYEKLEFDLLYINSMNILTDLTDTSFCLSFFFRMIEQFFRFLYRNPDLKIAGFCISARDKAFDSHDITA